jgi:ribonuclease BN (tRNA processing enzyme)
VGAVSFGPETWESLVSEVVFIGTSDAFGAGGRRQSAVLLRGSRGSLLLDCGATTATGLADLGIDRDEIETILVSHFHGDHFAGIPLLLLAALYQDQRQRPLWIAGPPDVERRVRELARAMGHAIEDREWTFPIHFTEVPAGGDYEIGPARIQSFETRHQIESCPQGYQVNLGRERIAYSGDTGWFEGLAKLSSGSDLFICECTFHRESLDFHLNLETLESHRNDFDCGRLLLTHLGEKMSTLRGRCSIDTADDGLVVHL